MSATLSKLSGKNQGALSQAGNIVEQTILQIRVVFAFVGESRALQAYSSALKTVQRLGYKSGFAKGLGLRATYFIVFCCYALLLWYGGYLVRHHYTNGGLAIATMFAISFNPLFLPFLLRKQQQQYLAGLPNFKGKIRGRSLQCEACGEQASFTPEHFREFDYEKFTQTPLST